MGKESAVKYKFSHPFWDVGEYNVKICFIQSSLLTEEKYYTIRITGIVQFNTHFNLLWLSINI